MHEKKPRNINFNAKLKAFRITLIYFVLGCVWIIFSDKIVDNLFVHSKDIITVSILKGLFYVVTTSAMVYTLIYPSFMKLKQNEERLHRSQKIANSGSWEINADSDMLLASDHFFHLLNLNTKTNLISIESIIDLIHEHERELFLKTISDLMTDKKKKAEMQYRIKPQGKDEFFCFNCIAENEHDKNGKVTKVLGVMLDITQIRRLEEERNLMKDQSWNQQKLESIGTLASGIAHEINNPINGIMNYGQIIQDSTESDSEINRYAKDIIYETNRVSEIVANLLEFSRQPEKQVSFARFEDIVFKTLSLVNTVFKHDNIILSAVVDENIPECKCKSQQIQQVIMNLLTNSRDSLNEKYPGYHENKKIELECHGFVKNNIGYISVSVKDFGMGISEEVGHRIFDPFFTTKDRSKGTGLGLSISYGIVKEHHGELTFESQKGEFTKFTMIIPCEN